MVTFNISSGIQTKGATGSGLGLTTAHLQLVSKAVSEEKNCTEDHNSMGQNRKNERFPQPSSTAPPLTPQRP